MATVGSIKPKWMTKPENNSSFSEITIKLQLIAQLSWLPPPIVWALQLFDTHLEYPLDGKPSPLHAPTKPSTPPPSTAVDKTQKIPPHPQKPNANHSSSPSQTSTQTNAPPTPPSHPKSASNGGKKRSKCTTT